MDNFQTNWVVFFSHIGYRRFVTKPANSENEKTINSVQVFMYVLYGKSRHIDSSSYCFMNLEHISNEM